MEKRTLVQAKELVNSSFPTIFSKEDVMNLLNSIEEVEEKEVEEGGKFSLSEEEISELSERIASKIEDVDVDYDLRLNIEVSGGIQIDTTRVERIASRILREFIEEANGKDAEE